MSSSVGAAIGVPEGIAAILREAEKMGSLSDMLVLLAIGVGCFGIPLQAGFAFIRVVQRHLAAAAVHYRQRIAPAVEAVHAKQR
jgi:hypothetical protein